MGEQCDVLLYGDLVLDIIFYLKDQLVITSGSYIVENAYVSPGGAAANTAVALSRLGVSSCLISAVGYDVVGKYLLEDLVKENVSIKYVKVLEDKSSGIVVSIVTSRREKTLLSYRNACRENIVPLIEVLNELKQAKIVYASGYMFDNVDQGLSLVKLFNTTREYGVKTFLELGGLPFNKVKALSELKGLVDFITLNEWELGAYFKALDASQALIKLHEMLRPEIVFVKMGDKGSILYDGHETEVVPPCNVNAVDPTGCGDAYNAGVIYGLIHGLNPVKAAQVGNAMGAYKIMGHGARFFPMNISELEAFMEKNCPWNLG
ncbi:MAG: carbohydrate kinase family protein [Desulfurococcaceae archaeon]